jgi:hypothetical protein
MILLWNIMVCWYLWKPVQEWILVGHTEAGPASYSLLDTWKPAWRRTRRPRQESRLLFGAKASGSTPRIWTSLAVLHWADVRTSWTSLPPAVNWRSPPGGTREASAVSCVKSQQSFGCSLNFYFKKKQHMKDSLFLLEYSNINLKTSQTIWSFLPGNAEFLILRR